jgi:cystinosin
MGALSSCEGAKSDGLCIFSNDVVGYIYTVAWGVSFLGQIGLNFQLKNVEGCNLDFVAYNVTGFAFYATYNVAGYFWPYESKEDPGCGVSGVLTNDLVFALWAFTMAIITFVQCFFVYPRYSNKISRLCIAMNGIYWFIAIFYAMLTNINGGAFQPKPLLNAVFMLSYIKLFISLTKYIPQAYWNYKRKSTVGWSIFNILLDFTGGTFSLLQILLNGLNGQGSPFTPSANGSSGVNIAKFGLSIISIFFDILFMIQHYILYKPKTPVSQQLILDPTQISASNPLFATGN